MSFDALCEKLQEEPFNPDVYCKTEERKFFKFEDSLYDRSAEETKIIRARTMPGADDTIYDLAKDDFKFGWMCGMDRDRFVQTECTNYSELMRNNCMLKATVKPRLKNALKELS